MIQCWWVVSYIDCFTVSDHRSADTAVYVGLHLPRQNARGRHRGRHKHKKSSQPHIESSISEGKPRSSLTAFLLYCNYMSQNSTVNGVCEWWIFRCLRDVRRGHQELNEYFCCCFNRTYIIVIYKFSKLWLNVLWYKTIFWN